MILTSLLLKQHCQFRNVYLQQLCKLERYLKQHPAYYKHVFLSVSHIENRLCSSIANNLLEEKNMDQNFCPYFSQSIALDDLESADLNVVTKRFNLKGLNIQYLNKYSVKVSSDLNTLIFPFDSLNGEFVSTQLVSYKKGEKTVANSLIKSHSEILFGWSLVKQNQKEIIITSDPLDAITINQETHMLAVSLPSHFSDFSMELLNALNPFSKIIFWLNPSLHNWKNHKTLGVHLKEKAFFISPDDFPCALSCLQNGSNIEYILKDVCPLHDKFIVTFESYEDAVREEIMGYEKTSGLKWKRFSVLNDLLKGHRPGELTIFSGQTGTGKTTFLSEYSLDLCIQGLPTLWASFEISNVKLIKTMLFQFSKQSLIGDIEAFNYWAEEFKKIPMNFISFGSKRWLFERILQALENAASAYRIQHLIVDNLQYMMNMEEYNTTLDQFRRQEQIFGYLREFANRRKCHVTLVIHPRKEPEFTELNNTSISGTAKAIQEADNIIILQTTKTRQYLQVSKNRYDGDKGCVIVEFDKKSLTFNMKQVSSK
ncbi:twinkle protein, mitochondrial [Trichonephila clavata]|uniref:Twinkle protein, mitochondrial n=1 Tax=Trichonephila clavata TaxID=2740835 RepID=A0A8X6IX96_TRICU|nr:twinkle protein, mitochondrial [Trichonephila clavata]